MTQNTSISLGNYFDNFVRNQINEGKYKNANEVVQAGLRLLEEHEHKVRALKNAIQEGIDSGIATDFNSDKFLQRLKSQKTNG
jgi:antitoxin ParD1/3/4